MSLRETLLAKANRRYQSEEIDGTVYWFQSITPAEAMNVSMVAMDVSKAGATYQPAKLVAMQSMQLCYSLVDGEGGDRLFGDDEVSIVQSIDNRTFQRLYAASEKLNGKGVDGDIEKKSESVPG